MTKRYKSPIFVWWQITHRCNLKCPHCFAYDISNELSTDEAKDVINQLSKAKIMFLKITGGEPFIRSDIFDLIDYALSKNLSIIISTNGTLLTKEKIKILSKLKINSIQISLDSANKSIHDKIRGKGTFTKTVMAIKRLIDSKINVAVVTTLMSHNVDTISETVDFVYRLGIKKFSTRRLVISGRAKENWLKLSPTPKQLIKAYSILREKSKQYPDMTIKPESSYMFNIDPLLTNEELAPVCECGKTQCGIKPDGTITPCEYITLPAGNLKKENFSKIWNTAKIFREFRELDISKLKGKCSNCKFKNICKGGCRALALDRYKDFYAQDPTCWL
jgi:radical SAM protein with 4Fe4S-binding SPASM domain